MSALFPVSLPLSGSALTTQTLAAAGHTALHNNGADESRAIATKIGTGSSTPTANTFLRGSSAGVSAWATPDISTADVTGTLPVSKGGTGATTAAGARTNLGINTQLETLAAVYPVGSIYIETTGTNPATSLGFGTWTAFAAGRTLIGVGTSDQVFAAAATGGESTHILTAAESGLRDHAHSLPMATSGASSGTGDLPLRGNVGSDSSFRTSTVADSSTYGSATTLAGASGSAHNNLPPYIVTYLWQRTA